MFQLASYWFDNMEVMLYLALKCWSRWVFCALEFLMYSKIWIFIKLLGDISKITENSFYLDIIACRCFVYIFRRINGGKFEWHTIEKWYNVYKTIFFLKTWYLL